jgi:hypothetical protein
MPRPTRQFQNQRKASVKKKPSPPVKAQALARPVESRTLPEAERDYRGTPAIPSDVLSGVTPLADPSSQQEHRHPLDALGHGEELGRQLRQATAETDEALERMQFGIPLESSNERLNWLTTEGELMEYMDSLVKAHKIEARNDTDLAQQLAKHFAVRGKKLKSESLRVTLLQQREKHRPK